MSRFIEGEELERLTYGNVLDAHGTDAFGRITVSSFAKAMREELAELNASRPLDEASRARKQELERLLPTTMTTSADRFLDSLGLDFDALSRAERPGDQVLIEECSSSAIDEGETP